MSRFNYRAYDGEGRLEQGAIEAASEKAALDALARRGRFPLEVVAAAPILAAPWWRRQIGGGGALPLADQAALARELATLLSARLPVAEALRTVALQPRLGTRARHAVAAAARLVGEGATLSEALRAQGAAMPEHAWRLVRAAEATGRLPEVLEELASAAERQARLRSSLVTALLYPAVLLVAALATLAVITAVTVPAIVPVFRDAGVAPPLPLAVVAWLHEAVRAGWAAVLVALLLASTAVAWAVLSTAARPARHRLLLRLPIVGRFVRHAATARLARGLAMLVGNGLPMVEALELAAGLLRNDAFQAATRRAAAAVNGGATLSAALLPSGLLPALAERFLRIGEESGQMVAMLQRIADIYEHDVEQGLARLLAVAAPAITVVVGLVVGGLLLSMMTAMLGLNEAVLR